MKRIGTEFEFNKNPTDVIYHVELEPGEGLPDDASLRTLLPSGFEIRFVNRSGLVLYVHAREQ